MLIINDPYLKLISRHYSKNQEQILFTIHLFHLITKMNHWGLLLNITIVAYLNLFVLLLLFNQATFY
jgi:hypothetical protein